MSAAGSNSLLHLRSAVAVGVVACLCLLVTGCGRKAPESSAAEFGDDVLAVVHGRAITAADFRIAWERARRSEDTPEARQAVLEQLMERVALAGAARELGLDRDPEVAAEVDRLLIGRLRSTRLQERLGLLTISEAKLAAEYEQNRTTRYARPEQVRAAVLWFDTRGQAPLVERYRPRLEAARAEVLQGGAAFPAEQGFGRLALTQTEHRVSRYKGGDIGWLSVAPGQDSWKTEVLRLASTLREPGDVSEVSTTADGIFLVRLMERRSASESSFESVREEIHRSLLAKARQQAEEDFTREILGSAIMERPDDAPARLASMILTPSSNSAVAAARSGPMPVLSTP